MTNVVKKYVFLPVLAVLFFTSCQLFEPIDENYSTYDRVLNEPGWAEGILDAAYLKLPTNSYSFNDVATDDAVSNDKASDYMRMATGAWSSTFNPMNQWSNCLSGIQAVNQFLTIVDSTKWRPSIPEVNRLYIRRLTGEAYGLRALLKYHLLVTVAGEDASGQLLGIPITDAYLDINADFNIPRATFSASIQSIYDDINKSLDKLTMDDYKDLPADTKPEDMPAGCDTVKVGNYNAVFGNYAMQRFSGRIAKALRAKVALLEASPAYSKDNNVLLWEKAARYSGVLLKSINGTAGLDPNGHRWFLKANVDAVNLAPQSPAVPVDQPEMIWRNRKNPSRTLEAAHFPPSLYGNGRVNPTQNLVDAFPMANGYPITDITNSKYYPNKPYTGRDPRLALYIIYNGSTFKSTTITTGLGGKENAKDSIPRSTRTGYYLKKLLVEQVNLNPTALSQENHYEVHFRYTDFFLMYAEAANEAWGPNVDKGDEKGVPFGFTALDVIRAIRKRAGIAQPDVYLNGITTKEDMRKLIHNERRLELCFEGFRFWDLRRWKENLNETAKGVEINRNGTEYRYVDVEKRLYKDYMYSCPIPNAEINKFSNLVQNKGW